MLKRVAALVTSGVQLITLLALDDRGATGFNEHLAGKLATFGVPCFACSPDVFPNLWPRRSNVATSCNGPRNEASSCNVELFHIMNKTATRFAFALILICTAYFAREANACSCYAQRTPYREFQNARAVFIGKALSSKDVATTETIRDKTYTVYQRVFQFAVSESLKGIKNAQIEINTGRIDSSCYHGFTIGQNYLVYAFGESDKSLGSHLCSRTIRLADAADDLHYLRNLLKGIPEPRLYGSVMIVDSDTTGTTASLRVTPLAGIKVLIESKDKKFEAVTDEKGLYSLARIPDGRYKARPLLPKSYRLYFPTEQEFIFGSQEEYFDPSIQQGASAYADFRVGWNNDIKGRIVDSEGNPIVRAKVSVLLAGSSSPLLVERDEYDLHDEGKYGFSGLNPGRYLLSVDIRAPFTDKTRPTTFFYPNASSLNDAREIRIGEDETLDDREIRLPPGYVVRQIEGVLVWPNGVPVSDGWITLAAVENAGEDDAHFDWGSTDELGRFSLQGFVGAEYWINGSTRSSGKAKPIKIKLELINQPVKIVIPFPKTEPERDPDPAKRR